MGRTPSPTDHPESASTSLRHFGDGRYRDTKEYSPKAQDPSGRDARRRPQPSQTTRWRGPTASSDCPTLCLRGPPAAHRPRLNHFPIPVRVKASSSQIAHDEPVAYGLWCANGLSVVLRSGGRGTGARLGLIRAFASPFAGRRWLFQLQGAIDCSDVRRKIAG